MNIRKGYKLSEETKAKIKKNHAKYWFGKKRDDKAKNKMSISRKGKTKSKEHKEKIRKSLLGKTHNEYRKKKISEANKGKHFSPKTEFKKGHIISEEIRKKISQSNKGEKSHAWLGGKSFESYNIDWTRTLKRAIKERDNYICQICSQCGDVVHHIDYNKKNSNPKNLITLCKKCHAKTNFNREKWHDYFYTIF